MWNEAYIRGKASTRGAMGRRIDPPWWNNQAIPDTDHCFTTGVI